MSARPRLVRSIPFWFLVAGSLAAVAVGGWLVLEKLTTMIVGLDANSATAADVYGGQSWIVVGAALAVAGLVGLVTVLALAVLRSFVPATATAADAEAADPIVDASGDAPAEGEPRAVDGPAESEAEPVTAR
ncbi:dinucleotide-utilizing enzyme [Microbacterium elymi]|uniref:Dinucleotide-utilizing enzyme n=1 Tax=Microbacterium elymi TaxID=2909587 RepID=A0ABY5NJH3_9MICO|nr:dinucleotide-utilizing enzyme [Microbacterium elymi]UUT35231.1 dinucleotide-utilizing enzyme [Microbacterium elymi]